MGQSVLRDRGTPFRKVGPWVRTLSLCLWPARYRKGIGLIFPNPATETAPRRQQTGASAATQTYQVTPAGAPGGSRKGKDGGDTTCGGTSQPHQAGKGGARSSPKGVVGQSDCPGGSRRVEAAPIQSQTLRSSCREVQRTEGVASLQESVTERRRANSPVALGEQLNGMVNQTGQGDPIQGANNEGCTFLREENTVYMFIPSARGTYTCTECPTACTKFRELATHYTTQHPDLDLKAKCSGCGFTGKFHSVSCHRPKCKGPERHQNGPTLDHRRARTTGAG